jgi:ABC-type multidrug transport system ATPase subunit
MTVLSVRGLARRFGRTLAVRDASFDVRDGEIVALLGPNGAGKTTLLDGLAGLTAMDAGTITIDGHPSSEGTVRRTLFYLPDGVTPWGDQPADWTLDFASGVLGARPTHAERRGVVETLRIASLGAQRVGTLSKGQRKRLLLAIALLAPQPIVLLDEPFDGLDLRLTRDTIALLRRLAARGRGFLLSIHAMRDAERVADRLVLLSDGRTIAEGTADGLRDRAGLPRGDLEEVFLALT